MRQTANGGQRETIMHTDTDLMDTAPKRGEIDPRYLGYSYSTNADGTYSITGQQGQLVKAMDAEESGDLQAYLDFAAKRGHSASKVSSNLCMSFLDANQY